MGASPNRSRIPFLLAASCALLPALLAALSIASFGVNSPHWDEWKCEGGVSRAWIDGGSLADALWQPCNEARPVVPKLVWLGVAILTSNNRVAEMWLGWLLVCLTAWNLYRISGNNLSFLAIANWVLFHPLQQDNWLWGSQNMLFVPALCLTAMLRCVRNGRVWWAGLLAGIGTYSFTNGLLLWPLLFLMLPWLESKHARRSAALIWAVLAVAASAGAIVRGGGADSAAGLSLWRLALRMAHYALTFLGTPVTGGGFPPLVPAMAAVGILGLIGFASVSIVRSGRWREALPWWILASYAVASASAAAFGRVQFGVAQAMENRYIGLACWLTIATVGLLLPVDAAAAGRWRAAARSCAVLAGVIAMLHWPAGARAQNNRSIAARYQRACLHFYPVLPGGSCTGNYPVWSLDYLKEIAPSFDRAGWIHPALATTAEVPDGTPPVTAASRFAVTVEPRGGGAGKPVRLRGSFLGGDPDAVVLASQDPATGRWLARRVVGVGRGWKWDPEARWETEVEAGAVKMRAYLYRADDEPRWQLLGEFAVPPPAPASAEN